MNKNTLLAKPLNEFKRIVKYEINENDSLDIDTFLDWQFAEFLTMNIRNIEPNA